MPLHLILLFNTILIDGGILADNFSVVYNAFSGKEE